MRLLLIGLVTSLTLVGCGGPTKSTETKSQSAAKLPRGWAEMTAPGFAKGYTAVAFFSRASNAAAATNEAYLAFIDAKGGVRLERVAPIENGVLRSKASGLAFDSEKDTFFIAGKDSEYYHRGGKHVGSGHWASFTPSGWDVSVLNIGRLQDGYLTEVNSQKAGQQIRNQIRDVPGAVGLDGDTLYLMSAGSSNADGTVSVYQVDTTKADSTSKVVEFRPNPDPQKMTFDSLSNLLVKDGALWFTYYQTPIGADGSFQNAQRTLRLGRLDLATRTFRSTPLSDQAYLLGDGPKGVVPVSVAGLGGYLHDGRMYTINTAGEIMAINLEQSTTENIGRVSELARNSFRVLASWHGDQLTLLSIDGRGGAQLETYSLRDARPTSSVAVPQLGSWYAQHLDILPWSVTALTQ